MQKHTHTLEFWPVLRDKTDLKYAQWTAKELKAHNKTTGLIGTKDGCECYVKIKNLL